MTKLLVIPWCPKDALDGMQLLDPLAELVYRRILDLIYIHENKLPDDPEVLAWATKAGDKWPEIRDRLIAMKKIYAKDGLIRNEKCDEIYTKIRRKMAQKRAAGRASAEARKSQKNNNDLTVVATGDATTGPTDHPTEGQRPANLTNEPLNLEPSSVSNETGRSPPGDLTSRIFGDCRQWLTREGGLSDKHARSFLGKLRKDYSDSDIIDAVAAAQRAGAQQPEAYIRKTLGNRAEKSGERDRTPGGAHSLESLKAEGLI